MSPYVPGLANIVAVLITWGIGAALLAVGTAVDGRRTPPEFRIAAGWGALCLVLTGWGVFVPLSLRIPVIGVAALVLAMQVVPGRRLAAADWRPLGRMLMLTLPLWLVMAPIRPSQVDTFLNLLPNAWYLVDYARLPAASLPPSYSFLPAAPYDTQFLSFLGSFVDRDYPAGGMSLVNVMLVLVAGLAIARALAPSGEAPSWGLTGLGMLLATLLNPGYVPRIDFAPYGEPGLAVTTLLAGLLFVAAQTSRAAGGNRMQLVALSLILAATLNIKQSGIGLVAALAGAAVVIGIAEPVTRGRKAVAETALVLIPVAALYLMWRWYVGHAGVAELTPLPFADWNWATLPATFRSEAAAIAEKPVYYIGVAVAIAGFPPLLRRQGWSPATRLLGFHAAVFVLYNGFLLATYIAHFSAQMSAEAHSYFRYSTHLSLLLVAALALLARELGRPLWNRPRCRRVAAAAAVAIALLTPLAFAQRLRFDLAMPQPLVWDLAAALKAEVKDGERLALLLPGDDGQIGDLLAAYLTEVPPRRRGLDTVQRRTADAATLQEVAELGYGLAVITCTGADLLGLPAGMAALLRHDPAGWQQVAAWSYAKGPAIGRYQRARSWPAICH
jgi:hypothetical protein